MKRFGHNPFLLLVLSLAAAYFSAIVFVSALYYSLPATDLAHGQGLLTTFNDPFLRVIGGIIATVCGVIGYSVALFCLRGRDLLRCSIFVLGSVTVGLLILTPFVHAFAVIGALVIGILTLLFCRSTKIEFFHQHESNQ